LGAAATPAKHADVPRRQPIEDFNTINAGGSSTSVDVVHNVQHIQKTPQDPSASHDSGGMTRIIPSDDVSYFVPKFNFNLFSLCYKFWYGYHLQYVDQKYISRANSYE
jgi:transcription factor E2F3